MSRSRWILSLCLMSALALPLAASATTALKLELTDLVQRSGLVITGRVASVIPRLVKLEAPRAGEQIRSEVRVEIDEVLKGQWAEPSITLDLLGGAIGEGASRRTQVAFGSPRFTVDADVLLFLERADTGRWVVTGLSQGLYVLSGPKGTPDAERVARRDVRGLHRVPMRRHEVMHFSGAPPRSDELTLRSLKGVLRGLRPRRAVEGLEVINPEPKLKVLR